MGSVEPICLQGRTLSGDDLVAVRALIALPPPQRRTSSASGPWGGGFRRMMEDSTNIGELGSIRRRDICILPDQASKTDSMVGPGFRTVRVFTSKDLVNWQGPQTIFRPATNIWGDVPVVNIWAPEMHAYREKYYLFLTFDTRNYGKDGGHAMLFRTFEGKLMMGLHSPNGPAARLRILEMEDTGETLRITVEFTGENP